MAFVAENIDQVLAQLEHIVERSKVERSRLGYFAALYRQVTLEIKRGILAGRFDDGPRMDRFDTAFANRYFTALDTWHDGGDAPKCWKTAFELMTDQRTIILQHLLLGVNAHINFDLAIAAVAAVPSGALPALAHDYGVINDILFEVLQHVQAAVDELSPFMLLLDELGGRDDEWALDFSIRTARSEAWNHACLLAHTDLAGRERLMRSMDRQASLLAQLVARPVGILTPALAVIQYKEDHDIANVIERLDRALPVDSR